MLREERGEMHRLWRTRSPGLDRRQEQVGEKACGPPCVGKFWASSPSDSLILMVQSIRPMYHTLEAMLFKEDIKVLPDFRETFKKKCCFILQLNKMPHQTLKNHDIGWEEHCNWGLHLARAQSFIRERES